MTTRKHLLLVLLAVFALIAASCGGDDDGDGDGVAADTEAEADDSSSSEEAASGDEGEEADSGSDEAEEAAPADGEIDRDATLIYATSFVANSLDVPKVSTDFAFTHVDPIYDTLVRRTPSRARSLPALPTRGR